MPQSWSPSAKKKDKKSVLSVYCGNKTTISYDRDNPFKKAAHRTIEFPNQSCKFTDASGPYLPPEAIYNILRARPFPNTLNQQSKLMFF